MRTIETTAVVAPDHTITVKLPEDIPPGACRVVVVVGDETPAVKPSLFRDWPAHDLRLTDPNCTFRWEDLYGDDGR
jgi:hypothetical protein